MRRDGQGHRAAGGGDAAAVTVYQAGQIWTQGADSNGVAAQSIGGGGGNGGFSVAGGFSIGTGLAAEVFNFFDQKLATRGIILMWQSVALTGGCMVFVMVLASILSLRRVLVLEPAIVFRG